MSKNDKKDIKKYLKFQNERNDKKRPIKYTFLYPAGHEHIYTYRPTRILPVTYQKKDDASSRGLIICFLVYVTTLSQLLSVECEDYCE
jgi:hypothetical protein